jgi:hypothetical protein
MDALPTGTRQKVLALNLDKAKRLFVVRFPFR